MTTEPPGSPLLRVEGLTIDFNSEQGPLRAVDNVSFDIRRGETLGLVGESGCGKSVTALAIMRLLSEPPGRITAGSAWFEGQDLLAIPEADMRRVRGGQVSMIFQEPMTSLNPSLTIGRQITELLELHLKMSSSEAKRRAVELLEMVGIGDAARRSGDYPHQLSGGQRQRVMIAIAMSCDPKLLIADEATTALDVTVQAQIMELLKEMAERAGTSLLIITHNLGIVARYADRVNVMYAGRIRESGDADSIYEKTRHPYTAGLLRSVPRLERAGRRLVPIRGESPDISSPVSGCAFRPRCDLAVDKCETEDPPLINLGAGHLAACWEHERVTPEALSN